MAFFLHLETVCTGQKSLLQTSVIIHPHELIRFRDTPQNNTDEGFPRKATPVLHAPPGPALLLPAC